jgi:hypothetical protein
MARLTALSRVRCQATINTENSLFRQSASQRSWHGAVWDSLDDQIDPRETSHRRHLNQSILHGRVAQRVSVLHQVNPVQGLQCIRRTLTF